jgi:protein tyrosine/serine phosphatase
VAATRRRLLPALLCAALLIAPQLDPGVSALFSILDTGVAQFAVPLMDVRGMTYVAKVRHGVYRGSKPDEEGVDWLRKLGVRTVINLRGKDHDEGELVHAAGMRYEWIPLRKTHAPTQDEIRRFFDIIADRAAYPIYVHCLYGVDRTGTMMALYRMREQGWKNMDALAEMKHFGDHGFKDMRKFIAGYRI